MIGNLLQEDFRNENSRALKRYFKEMADELGAPKVVSDRKYQPYRLSKGQ